MGILLRRIHSTALAGLLLIVASSAANGQVLDTLFGNQGTIMNTVSAGSGNSDHAYSVVIQQDGKIIAAGDASDHSTPYSFAMARYDTNGMLDTTFGNLGVLRTDYSSLSMDRGYGVALQTDGKIIMVGSCYTDYMAFGVARYNSDGSFDTSFAHGGWVNTYLNGKTGAEDQANCVVLQGDGKIVAAGSTHNVFGRGEFGVVRYKTNGDLDSTFGTSGESSFFINGGTNTDDACNSIALQNDGKIVLAGSCYAYTDSTRYAFGLARLNSDGSLDTTFGNEGTVMTHIGNGGLYTSSSGDYALSVAIQSDGKILAAGYSMNRLGHYSLALLRYTTFGILDTTFGIDKSGIVLTHFPGGNGTYDFGRAVVIQPNKKILVAGNSVDSMNYSALAVARYLPDGVLDYDFGDEGTGTVRVFVDGAAHEDQANAMALQPDGRIVLAGASIDYGTCCEFSLARLYPHDSPTRIGSRTSNQPVSYALTQNYPNPFNPSTTIEFALPTESRVELVIFNVLGQKVATLVDGTVQAGYHDVIWNASSFSSGVYFSVMKSTSVSTGQNFRAVKKLMLVK